MSSSEGEYRTRTLIDTALSLHRSSYVQDVQEALNSFPDRMKTEYHEALQRCPNLVKTESDQLKFLRREKFNCYAAAVRLLSYWRERKAIFGERAFRPMDISGDGALSRDDLRPLNCGILSLIEIPEDEDDDNESKQCIVVCDPTRLEVLMRQQSFRESYLRCVFYFIHLLSEKVECQRYGFTLLIIISQRITNFLDPEDRFILNVLARAVPVKVKKIIFAPSLSTGKPPSTKYFTEKLVPKALGYAGSAFGKLAVVVSGNNKEAVWRQLAQMGMKKEFLPPGLGGSNITNDFLPPLKTAAAGIDDYHFDEEMDSASFDSPPTSSESDHGATKASKEKMDANGCARVEEALLLISDEEKAAYLEAKRIAPELVESETPLVKFLHAEKYNPWAAARRVVLYWAMRKQIFGDRAHFPMDLTASKSALTEFDRAVLETGWIVVLPPDSEGRRTVCVNYKRINEPTPEFAESRIRLVFFLVNKESEVSKRFVVMHIYSEQIFRTSPGVETLKKLMFEALPIRMEGMYVLFLTPKTGWRSHIRSGLSWYAQEVFGILSNTPVSVCIANTRHDMLAQLEANGFLKEGLPELVGGHWSYSTYLASLKIVSFEEHASLQKALKKSPQLVEKESSLQPFFELEGNNAEAAALRREAYWKERIAIFGDRAFFPMNQSGEGTLSNKDIQYLGSGCMVLLKSTRIGSPVLCFNPSRTKDLPRNVTKRLVFYMGSVMAEDPAAVEKGCSLLIIANRLKDLDRVMLECLDLLRCKLPLRIESVHVVLTPPMGKWGRSVDGLSDSLRKSVKTLSLKARTVIHIEDSIDSLSRELDKAGFIRSSLPDCVGGDWTYNQFQLWQELRLR